MGNPLKDPPDLGCTEHWRRVLSGLVGGSLVFGVALLAYISALQSTPWETTDSRGGSMGFNDPLNGEHHAIIWKNASVRLTLGAMEAKDWLFVCMHGMALAMLWGGASRRQLAGFFVVQPLIFYWGWLAVFLFPSMIGAVVSGLVDRESFTDGPIFEILAQGVWLAVAAAVLAVLWVHRTREREQEKESPLERPLGP